MCALRHASDCCLPTRFCCRRMSQSLVCHLLLHIMHAWGVWDTMSAAETSTEQCLPAACMHAGLHSLLRRVAQYINRRRIPGSTGIHAYTLCM